MKWFKHTNKEEYTLRQRGTALPVATLVKCGNKRWKLNGVCGLVNFEADDGIKEANRILIDAYQKKIAGYKRKIQKIQNM